MSYNLYLGADLSPVLLAETSGEFHSALTATLAQVANTNFAARAQVLAREIGAAQPDLIGLQEAVVWQQSDAGTSLVVDTLDYLAILLDALSDVGVRYRPVAAVPGTTIALPTGIEPAVAFTNRNVILARELWDPTGSRVTQAHSGNFSTNVIVNSPHLGAVSITRGSAAVDVKFPSGSFRFLAVHLEDSHMNVQRAQAEELVLGLQTIDTPVVLVGDFNATPDLRTATYATLIAAGFRDTWQLIRQDTPGYTCCQAADLRNRVSTLADRIDWILVRGEVEVLDVFTVGDDPARRTTEGLWPSDHAGIVATLRID